MSSTQTFLSIGECMLELSQADGQLWRMGYAGDTLNTAWYVRAILDDRRGGPPISPGSASTDFHSK